jgi:hypothetical protein
VIERFNIPSLLRKRADQASFHVAAEKHVRLEFRNMKAGDSLGPFTYGGDVVAICYRGDFRLEVGTEQTRLGELDQAVVPEGTSVRVVCESPGSLQLIWSPPQAPTVQERRT